MKFAKRMILGVGLAVVALLILPYLIPLAGFIPDIERRTSEQLRDTVKVESLRLFFLPSPHLVINGVTVGRKPYLQVGRITVRPRLLTLLDPQKVIREISLEEVIVGQRLLPRASSWAGKAGTGDAAPLRVERVSIRNADLILKDVRLRQLDMDLELTEAGGLALLEGRVDQGRLRATLVPQGKSFVVNITASEWRLPVGPPLMLSALKATGTVDPNGLNLSRINGRLYGGTMDGRLVVGWAGDWIIQGRLNLKDVEVRQVVALYARETVVSGRLDANPVVDMHASSADQLAQALHVQSDFNLKNGVLFKIDLANAAKAFLNKDAIKGGETRFDEFSGNLLVDATGYHLANLKISSGVLKAEGEISVAPDQKLSGRIDAAVRGTSALISTPLAVSGTLKEPAFFPTKAALAGAAAGTALLGPGLGTTVGLKAVQITEKLFGGKPSKKKEASRPIPRDTSRPPALKQEGDAPPSAVITDQAAAKKRPLTPVSQ